MLKTPRGSNPNLMTNTQPNLLDLPVAEPANGAATNGTAKRRGKTAPILTTTQQLGSLVKSARDIMRKDRGLSGDVDRLPLPLGSCSSSSWTTWTVSTRKSPF
jgi:hypothetical protein